VRRGVRATVDNAWPMSPRASSRSLRPLALAAALFALAGCGSDAKFLGGSSAPPPIQTTVPPAVKKEMATPGQENVKAITNVNIAVAAIESCGTRTGDYRQCVTAADLGSELAVSLGSGVNQAKISG